MKIAYVTHYDARNPRSYSGIARHIALTLERQDCCVEYVGPLSEGPASFPLKIKQQFYRSILRQDHHRDREPAILKHYAQQVAQHLEHIKPDVVLSPSAIPTAYLDTPYPIVFWSDATFNALVGFYPDFTNLSLRTLENGTQMEQQALQRCRLAIYSSEWAAESAVALSRSARSKVKVVPYGANLDTERTECEVRAMIEARPPDVCNLLFVGKEWERKGGPKAVEVTRALNEAGLRTRLTILGCMPPPGTLLPKDAVETLGFVDKQTVEGLQTIENALSNAHFLIMPSRADCTPIVIPEANAFGVPCLTSDVGGIPSLIRAGDNGLTFPLDASTSAYVTYVNGLFSRYEEYRRLAWSAFEAYRDRLNWGTSVRRVYELLTQLV